MAYCCATENGGRLPDPGRWMKTAGITGRDWKLLVDASILVRDQRENDARPARERRENVLTGYRAEVENSVRMMRANGEKGGANNKYKGLRTQPVNGTENHAVLADRQERQDKREKTPIVPVAGDDFAAFWLLYPKKIGKGAAERAWKNQRPPIEAIRSALAWQVGSDQWTRDRGQYVPNPSTYLTQKRWEDERQVVTERNQRPLFRSEDQKP